MESGSSSGEVEQGIKENKNYNFWGAKVSEEGHVRICTIGPNGEN
jgi:hypothetical protein